MLISSRRIGKFIHAARMAAAFEFGFQEYFQAIPGDLGAAHAAAEAAKLQGKFWPMHDKLFEGQRLLSDAQYEAWAGEIGLDVERFKKDAASAAVKKQVDEDLGEAKKLGVTGTPAFFINGRFLSGAQPFDSFKRMVDRELGG